MTIFKVNDIRKALLSKGFREIRGGDHIFYWFYYRGIKTLVRTKISHGKDEYGEKLLKYMSLQLHLERNEFDDFIDCILKEEDYAKLLIEKGVIRH